MKIEFMWPRVKPLHLGVHKGTVSPLCEYKFCFWVLLPFKKLEITNSWSRPPPSRFMLPLLIVLQEITLGTQWKCKLGTFSCDDFLLHHKQDRLVHIFFLGGLHIFSDCYLQSNSANKIYLCSASGIVNLWLRFTLISRGSITILGNVC